MFCISWKYYMVVYDECIAFLILGNIGRCIYLTEIFAELYRWWQRMIENDFPKLVNRIQKSSELILREGGVNMSASSNCQKMSSHIPHHFLTSTTLLQWWFESAYIPNQKTLWQKYCGKKVVPKILRPRTYWHQQFETSTGDKTHTDHILPGGKPLSSPDGKSNKYFANQRQISNKYPAKSKQISHNTYLRRNILSSAAP